MIATDNRITTTTIAIVRSRDLSGNSIKTIKSITVHTTTLDTQISQQHLMIYEYNNVLQTTICECH